jgi:hypothetical protein
MKTTLNESSTIIDKLDFFAIPVPSFTMQGKTKIGSPFGAFLSIVMFVIVLA